MAEEKADITSLTPEEIGNLIKLCEDDIKDKEESLSSNTEWPDEKQMDRATLWHIGEEEKKGKLGWYSKRVKRSLEEKIKKNNYKPPKKLNETTREFLENYIAQRKETIIFLKIRKEAQIKYPEDWQNKKVGELYKEFEKRFKD